jgi:phospholipase C
MVWVAVTKIGFWEEIMSLQDIDTFVIVMLENRSFDHLLGYLSLKSANPPVKVDGLHDDQNWQENVGNDYQKQNYKITRLDDPKFAIVDPPHTSIAISQQIETPPHLKSLKKMGGFVQSYAKSSNYNPGDPQPAEKELGSVMGYYTKPSVSIFDFFARNFAVCDKWFSSLPTSTQPNRLMAMSGESKIGDNVKNLGSFPAQDLVYDWLNKTPDLSNPGSAISWCSYQWSGFPFFTLMSTWRGKILAQLNDPNNVGNFRHYGDVFQNGQGFKAHWKSGGPIPSVVFIEPKYTDDVIGGGTPNDDHPPTAIAEGQAFLTDIYNTLISNLDLWSRTMMIVTYDEHGGFFDHVDPIDIPAYAGDQYFPYTGVRVPAFVISPQVKAGTVFQGPLDHTSILQLLADRFAHEKVYSQPVTDRQSHLVRLSTILSSHMPSQVRAPKVPGKTLKGLARARAGAAKIGRGTTSSTETAQAFRQLEPLIRARYPTHPSFRGPAIK